jgi:hypothetical protein
LSFWGRSTVTTTIRVRIAQEDYPGTDYGFSVYPEITPQWQHFQLWDTPAVTAGNGEIEFQLGSTAGEFWFDDIHFQKGAVGVWARQFEHGLVVINSTLLPQRVALPGAYCTLSGPQAPLEEVRIDDDEAVYSPGWRQQPANLEQFGFTIHTAEGGSNETASYTPTLSTSTVYEVSRWAAPNTHQAAPATVTIKHAQGVAQIKLDQAIEKIGWHSLGFYRFDQGAEANVTLSATGDGTVVADAFKWTSLDRYNDGRMVVHIDLAPQDARILLESCTPGSDHLFLPSVLAN